MRQEIPATLGILLIDGFALMSYASVVEPFRAANVLSGKELYRWRHVSIDGRPVQASNGASILSDLAIGDAIDVDILFVIAGGDPTAFSHRPTFAWLRRLARTGVHMAGVSGGPYLLAQAGLLEGYRCTIHWDHVPALTEAFPRVLLESSLFVIDRQRSTCAGGSAGLDLSIDMIERSHGHDLAVEVSEWFIRTQPRPSGDAQRMSVRERYNISNPRLLKVLHHMEATIEEPESRETLIDVAGVSMRQLERLFKNHLHASMGEVYRRIRLDHAQALLRKTGLSVTDVAIACGFNSTSHFSRAFSNRFGKPPSGFR